MGCQARMNVRSSPAADTAVNPTAPHVYKVAFENERVRLLEVRLEPGAKSELHSHPNYLAYVLSGGKLHEGENLWREAEEHSAENVGTTEMRALFFELK